MPLHFLVLHFQVGNLIAYFKRLVRVTKRLIKLKKSGRLSVHANEKFMSVDAYSHMHTIKIKL